MENAEGKRCPGCKEFKARSAFGISSNRKDGLQIYCKACRSSKSAEKYKENHNNVRTKLNERRRKSTTLHKDYIESVKSGVPCMDCGGSFPSYVMDFDHVTGIKLFNISSRVSCGVFSLDKLKEEIAKCELVCANCHRVRTHTRRSDP